MSPDAPLWQRALFPRHAAFNLAVMRLFVGGFALWHLVTYRYSIIRVCTRTAPEHYRPVGIASILPAPLPDELFVFLFYLSVVVMGAFVLGLGMRLAGPVGAVLLLFVLTYRQSFGFVYHTENLVVLHALVLGFSRSADALSLDSLLARRWPAYARFEGLERLAEGKTMMPSWRYGWPAQLMVLLTGVTYWVAGAAKLGESGLAWVTEAHLLDHIGNNALRYHFFSGGASSLTLVAYTLPFFVWPMLAVMSLLFELFAPAAILDERLALVFAVGLFGFHWGVLALMGIPFLYQLTGVCYVVYIRWDKLAHFVKRKVWPRLRPPRPEGAVSS